MGEELGGKGRGPTTSFQRRGEGASWTNNEKKGFVREKAFDERRALYLKSNV